MIELKRVSEEIPSFFILGKLGTDSIQVAIRTATETE